MAHANDTTGQEINCGLLGAVLAHPEISVREGWMGVDLLTLAQYSGPDACFGAYALDGDTGQVHTILPRATILASGGAGKVYLYTSNPDVATGDGVAMAYLAGAQVT